MSNARVLKIKRFVPGDKPIQSWTTSASIAEKFYVNIHASHNRGKTADYAWVILEADMSRYATVNVATARQFLVDLIVNRDSLIDAGVLKEDDYYTQPTSLRLSLQRLSSSFIQSQQEVICLTKPGKAIPCSIYKIMRRGDVVRKNYNY